MKASRRNCRIRRSDSSWRQRAVGVGLEVPWASATDLGGTGYQVVQRGNSPDGKDVTGGWPMSAGTPARLPPFRREAEDRETRRTVPGKEWRQRNGESRCGRGRRGRIPLPPLKPTQTQTIGYLPRIFSCHARAVPGSTLSRSPAPNSPAKHGCVPRRRRYARAARSSVFFCARRTEAVRNFCALLPLPALRPGIGRAPSVAALPLTAAPHLRRGQKFAAPRFRCCRCGRDGRAPLGLRLRRAVFTISLWSKEFGSPESPRLSPCSLSKPTPETQL